MKHLAMTAAAVAAVGTLFAAPSAVAAPGQGAGSAFTPASGASQQHSASAKAPTAASLAAAYNGACGSGYGVIDSLPISTLGTAYLTYNSSTGKNCVVTVRANPGTAMYMAAAIRLAGNSASEVIDAGNYTTYAGPVYLYAAGKCIDWGGQIGSVYNQEFGSHCG
ncbi:spore-associated protein A [Streptomyces sp.]|uniref:spore-associated protein A n=1 Tax=Streptomyces sp. TaxID=1931 RepID=UPI002F3F7C31